jgi:hypothetical protein
VADLVGSFHRYFDLVGPSAVKFPLPTRIEPYQGISDQVAYDYMEKAASLLEQ